jgi:DNA-repair protein XRCC3
MISLACPVLDAVFRGGLRTGSITELVGEPGAGKTQLALQCAAAAACGLLHPSSAEGSLVIWLYTEGPPPIRRLQQLVDGTCTRCNLSPDLFSLDNIAVIQGVSDSPQGILHSIEQVRAMCQSLRDQGGKTVSLFIIDSVAWVFRDVGRELGGEGGEATPPKVEDFSYRASLLFKLGGELKRLASDFCLSVLVTNQVMDGFEDNDNQSQASSIQPRPRFHHNAFMSCGRRVVPALGLSWSNCVNHRIFLSRELGDQMDRQSGTCKRSLRVVLSSCLPLSGCDFIVLPEKVVGVHSDVGDNTQQMEGQLENLIPKLRA